MGGTKQDWQGRSPGNRNRDLNRWSSRPQNGFGGYDRSEDDRLDYQGRYYNRGNFNPGWDMEEDYDYDRNTGYLYDPLDRDWSRTSEAWWVVPGPYSGVGPRNYHRSDEHILEEVNSRLYQHGQIDASDIEVEVKGGEVWLRGLADSRRIKRLAEDIVEEVFGVNDIHNELLVRQDNRNYQPSQWEQYQATGIRRQTGEKREETYPYTERQMETQNQAHILPGTEVVGSDGGSIGRVKDIRENDFLVDRPMTRDVYIPFSACRSISGQVVLNILSDQVNDQNWSAPEVFGLGGEGQEGMNG